MLKNSKTTSVILILTLISLFSGCIFQNTPAAQVADNTSGSTLKVVGNVDITTAISRLAIEFDRQHPGDSVIVSGNDDEQAIGQLISGQSNICYVSRPPTSQEYIRAKDKGVKLQMTEIGLDSIVVYVNPANGIKNLNLSQLHDIFYSDKIKDWSGLTNGTNNQTISVYVPADPDMVRQFDSIVNNSEYGSNISQNSHEQIVPVVINDMNGISYGLVSSINNSVNMVNVNGVSYKYGNYPLTHQLYMITNGTPDGLSLEFINYVLGHDGQKIIHDAGLTPLDPTI